MRKLRECVVRHRHAPARLLAAPRAWKVLIAWAVNVGLFAFCLIGLVYVLASRALLPRALQAAASDDSEWQGAFVRAMALATIQNLLLVDGFKVLCLTATSPGGALEACSANLRGKVVRKAVSKLHKAIDAVM